MDWEPTGVIVRQPLDLRDGASAQTDPDAFFPEQGGSTRAAKKVCQSCDSDIRTQCLAYALANNEQFGVWGGLSGQERRRLQRAAARKVGNVIAPTIEK